MFKKVIDKIQFISRRYFSTSSQIMILLSRFNYVIFESKSLTHISWLVVHWNHLSWEWMEHLALIGSRWCSKRWSTETSWEVTHPSPTPDRVWLTTEFRLWLNPLYLQPYWQNLHKMFYLMNQSVEIPLTSSIDK